MRLYEGTCQQFIDDTIQNRIVDKLVGSFGQYGLRVSPGEKTAWTNSLQFLKNAVERAAPSDTMIILEYMLPHSNKRIDCMLFGIGQAETENIILIELKQWEIVKDCEMEDMVITILGQSERPVAHPSVQLEHYHSYLKDFMQIFEEGTTLHSCAYCHNYTKNQNSVLFLPKFGEAVQKHPIFTKSDFESFVDYLRSRLEKGDGLEIFNKFVTSNIRPSKKLVEYTSEMMKGQKVFNLIDEQLAANNVIVDRAKKCTMLTRKSVIVVRGGPGTGKSVIALNALTELLSRKLVVYHATGSAAFTRTLQKIVGTRAAKLFKYFHNFGRFKEDEIDVIICDEAHRIRKNSNLRFTPRAFRSNVPQMDEIIRAGKVCVFFIDEFQIVRPTEIGNLNLIMETAKKYNAEIFEFELKTQFRCSGSDGYLNWIDNTLGVRETANRILTAGEKMEFKIFESPHALYEAIKAKNSQKPNSARLVAGFCWPWSNPKSDGTLINDVVIGDFEMPWEGKDGKKLARGIPPAPLWAYDPNGVSQIGCIYTIQGFEFEYVGVIFGPDLVYDPSIKEWGGRPEKSADPGLKRGKPVNFTDYVKNVYRVLLTRGMKGCYVYFMDKNTENYFKSRVESFGVNPQD